MILIPKIEKDDTIRSFSNILLAANGCYINTHQRGASKRYKDLLEHYQQNPKELEKLMHNANIMAEAILKSKSEFLNDCFLPERFLPERE